MYQLFFDWRKEPALRTRHIGIAATGVIGLVFAIMSARAQSADSKQSEAELVECNRTGVDCNAKVSQLSKDADRNADAQRKSLLGLGEEVGSLKGEVTNERLKSHVANLEKQLTITNAPKPLAVVTGSFATSKAHEVVKETWAVRRDHTIKVDLMMLNTSQVNAENVTAWVFVCDDCTFAKEPPGFEKPNGSTESMRDISYLRILPASGMAVFPVEIEVPLTAKDIHLGVRVKCTTCVLSADEDLTVHVTEPDI